MKCKMETYVTSDLMCKMHKVYIEKCNDYDESAKNAIKNILLNFPILNNIKQGTKVVIKANLVSAMSPENAVVTHPTLLKYLSEFLEEKGAKVLIGDSPSGLFNKSALLHIYKETQLDSFGLSLNENFNISKANFNKAKVLKSFEYTSYLDDADIKINFSKLKTHAMMAMSASVKNLFGCIPGTTKLQYHYRFPNHDDFANMLIDINEYFKFDINIIDAVVGMEGNGPTMGTPRKIGCIMASSNPYALDYIASKIINVDYKNVNTINKSIERKLFDPKNIELSNSYEDFVVKNFKNIVKFKSLIFYSDSNNLFYKSVSQITRMLFSNKPNLNKKKCVGCGLCYRNCPKKAITMINGYPKIDRNKCIKCYCCQEFCPKGAMYVKSSFVSKIIK